MTAVIDYNVMYPPMTLVQQIRVCGASRCRRRGTPTNSESKN